MRKRLGFTEKLTIGNKRKQYDIVINKKTYSVLLEPYGKDEFAIGFFIGEAECEEYLYSDKIQAHDEFDTICNTLLWVQRDLIDNL